MRKIFASSPGWNWTGPTSTHSLTPLTRCPSPGTDGSSRSTIAEMPNTYL